MYSRDLLRLALRLAEQGRLDEHDGSAERRSRACGSVVTTDVRLREGRIVAFGQDVRACAVGQASAAILGSHIIGLKRADVVRGQTDLSNYLTGLCNDPGEWPEIGLIAEVRAYAGRHAAALLPYEAALAAIDQALSRQQERAYQALSASRNAAISDS